MPKECYKIYGPPGTGKTTKMLALLENELEEGIEAKNVVWLSFTRNAVKEAKERALRKFPHLDKDDFRYFRTMHSICYGVLGLSPERIAIGSKLFKFGNETGYEFQKASDYVNPDELFMDDTASNDIGLGSYLLSIWDYFRTNLWSLDKGLELYPFSIEHPQLFGRGPGYMVLADFVKQYENWKQENSLVDFTDMPLKVLRFNQRLWPPANVIFADEAQDFSPLQWKVLELWAGEPNDREDEVKRLYLAADDDQAIFSYQGAKPEHFLDHYGVETVLNRSYRLPEAIWRYTRTLIERNTKRKQKEFAFNTKGGCVERITWLSDIADGMEATAAGSSNESWFLLARHRYLLEEYANYLKKRFIPFHNRRGQSYFQDARLLKACDVALKLKDMAEFEGISITWGELNSLIQDYVPSQYEIALQPSMAGIGDGYTTLWETSLDPDYSPPAKKQEIKKDWLILRGGKKQIEDIAKSSPNVAIRSRAEMRELGITSLFFELLDSNPFKVIKFKGRDQQEYISGSYERYGRTIFQRAALITLATIHSSKGEEADNVVVMPDVSRKCYVSMIKDIEPERRVFYVACTRARQNLYLLQPTSNLFFDL